jgi:hypothetical protein
MQYKIQNAQLDWCQITKYIISSVLDTALCIPLVSPNRRSWHGNTTPPFLDFLFTYLFAIKCLYFFIISSPFPYFNLFVSIFI